MSSPSHPGLILLTAALAIACAAPPCPAQSMPAADTAPCSVAPQPAPCGAKPATPAKPNAAEKFPFPGEDPTPGIAPAPAASTPDAPAVAAPARKSAGDAFPFPGDPAADSSSSSSSSSSSDDTAPDPAAAPTPATPAQPGLSDKGSEGAAQPPGRHILHRVNPIGTKLETDDERETEDLDIAHFYTQTGDLQGAYLRSQDAVKIAPGDPDAHFALAEAARKLNKRDQAIAEYSACLKFDPSDKEAAASRKELARLKR